MSDNDGAKNVRFERLWKYINYLGVRSVSKTGGDGCRTFQSRANRTLPIPSRDDDFDDENGGSRQD